MRTTTRFAYTTIVAKTALSNHVAAKLLKVLP